MDVRNFPFILHSSILQSTLKRSDLARNLYLTFLCDSAFHSKTGIETSLSILSSQFRVKPGKIKKALSELRDEKLVYLRFEGGKLTRIERRDDRPRDSPVSDFLLEQLKHGPCVASEILFSARRHGFSRKVIYSEKKKLRIESARNRDHWFWSLPNHPNSGKIPKDSLQTDCKQSLEPVNSTCKSMNSGKIPKDSQDSQRFPIRAGRKNVVITKRSVCSFKRIYKRRVTSGFNYTQRILMIAPYSEQSCNLNTPETIQETTNMKVKVTTLKLKSNDKIDKESLILAVMDRFNSMSRSWVESLIKETDAKNVQNQLDWFEQRQNGWHRHGEPGCFTHYVKTRRGDPGERAKRIAAIEEKRRLEKERAEKEQSAFYAYQDRWLVHAENELTVEQRRQIELEVAEKLGSLGRHESVLEAAYKNAVLERSGCPNFEQWKEQLINRREKVNNLSMVASP